MAVHANVKGVSFLAKLALGLGKAHAAHAATTTVLALWVGTGVLAAVAAGLLLSQMTDLEMSDEKARSESDVKDVANKKAF